MMHGKYLKFISLARWPHSFLALVKVKCCLSSKRGRLLTPLKPYFKIWMKDIFLIWLIRIDGFDILTNQFVSAINMRLCYICQNAKICSTNDIILWYNILEKIVRYIKQTSRWFSRQDSLQKLRKLTVGDQKEIVEQNSEIQGLERACSRPWNNMKNFFFP